MPHKLVGDWRVFFVNRTLAPHPTQAFSSDGVFKLLNIDESTGEIIEGYHDIGGSILIRVQGRATPIGASYLLTTEHPDKDNDTKMWKYEAILSFESSIEDRKVIIGSRTSYHRPELTAAETAAAEGRQQEAPQEDSGVDRTARTLNQDDGTVIIVKP